MAKLHPLLEPWKPTSNDPFDSVKAAHLLNRACFGGTRAEIEHVLAVGPERAVDELLDFPDAPSDEQSQTDQPNLSAIEGYPRSFREYRSLIAGKTAEERMRLRQQFQQANRAAVLETARWWMTRMANGPHPLQEKLTLFWHGHFTTSAREERSAWLMWQQNELLRRYAAGGFVEFTKAISRDPAMLDYLNNQQNRKSSPNENYARELMELFTLGIGNYTEKDVKEAARAFTGWGHDGDSFVFRRFDHDNEPKTFMGRTGNWNGDDIVDMVAQHPACAPYIAGKLFAFFAHENPDPAMIASLGNEFRGWGYQLRPLIRTILLSRAFYAPASIGTQVKSPIQLVVGTARKLGVELPPARLLFNVMEQMGQVPLAPPNVRGWPGGRAWINTSTLFVRYNTAVWLAGGEPPIASGRPGVDRVARSRGVISFRPVRAGEPREVVESWLSVLIPRPVPETKVQPLLDAVGPSPTEKSVTKMVQLIVSMPEYQLC